MITAPPSSSSLRPLTAQGECVGHWKNLAGLLDAGPFQPLTKQGVPAVWVWIDDLRYSNRCGLRTSGTTSIVLHPSIGVLWIRALLPVVLWVGAVCVLKTFPSFSLFPCSARVLVLKSGLQSLPF